MKNIFGKLYQWPFIFLLKYDFLIVNIIIYITSFDQLSYTGGCSSK